LYIWRRLCFIRSIPVHKKDDFLLSKDAFLLNEEIVEQLRQPMNNDELGKLRSMSMDDSAVDTEVQRGFAVHNRKKLSSLLHRVNTSSTTSNINVLNDKKNQESNTTRNSIPANTTNNNGSNGTNDENVANNNANVITSENTPNA